ncbi:hypothetical protein HGI30_20965 [Paenibacillus albicereus]|uniref:Type I restriction modification DNA specificity domain-containing protein n=1 Tax=Paenibacillus albicereus TaxID=2726185 RepID=A0A6H2H273_9BACL|nr:restriction endonuclease subunit S [Paenibacillus albicereus]QJC53747.1 hypothetical protein HGI30_20965 [Paenibacillus albicereus]
MSKWEKKKLGEIGNGYVGLTYSPEEVSESGIIVLRSGNIKDNKLDFTEILRVKKELSEKLIIKNNDILICARNGSSRLVGKATLISETKEKMTFGAFMMIYRSDFNRYLVHYFHSLNFRRQLGNSATTTINQITRKMLDSIVVPFPPSETQKHIAKTLDTAAELLAMRKQQLEELDNLINATFYKMFGDPISNERGWKKTRIGEFAKVETGATPDRGYITYYRNGQIPWVKTGEVSKGYITASEENISEIAIHETNCKVFPVNSVLIAMYGQGKTRGQAGLLHIAAATNQACAAIIPNNQYNSEYLYRTLKISYQKVREMGRGGNQQNLNLSLVKMLEVPLPPLRIQNDFSKIVAKIEEQKTLVKKIIRDTQNLIDALTERYFK